MTDYQLFIDGVFCDASDGGRFDCVNPATGMRWATAPAATADDVDRAVNAAAIYDYTRTKTVWVNTSDEPMANPFLIR